ncbi:hypothetical protein AB8807_22140 (plasmid) [Xanthomonas campestris pv. olitorii]|nr:hypothetical protein KWH09_22380 [Xanthomonas campestris pv. olitorii]
MEATENDSTQRRAMFEALHCEKSQATVAFRDYWRKENDAWRNAVKAVNSVVTGATPVSDAEIENCRLAIMRLHQIKCVLGQLMLSVGSPSPGVLDAVMDIIARIDKDTAEATTNLKLILQWHAAANVRSA